MKFNTSIAQHTLHSIEFHSHQPTRSLMMSLATVPHLSQRTLPLDCVRLTLYHLVRQIIFQSLCWQTFKFLCEGDHMRLSSPACQLSVTQIAISSIVVCSNISINMFRLDFTRTMSETGVHFSRWVL